MTKRQAYMGNTAEIMSTIRLRASSKYYSSVKDRKTLWGGKKKEKKKRFTMFDLTLRPFELSRSEPHRVNNNTVRDN
jgi:hypothetical protein